MKELSAGVCIFDPEGALFIVNATRTSAWGVPKGHVESDETPVQAAIRELYEETGITVSEHDIVDAGRIPYRKSKDLHLFVAKQYVHEIAKSTQWHCITDVTVNGQTYPETCKWHFEPDWRNVCGHNMVKAVSQALANVY